MRLYRINKSKIDNKGRGLYATKNIKAGTKIIEIIPSDHPSKKCERISKFLNLKYFRIKTKKNNFDKNYPFKIHLEQKHLKMIQKIIDL